MLAARTYPLNASSGVYALHSNEPAAKSSEQRYYLSQSFCSRAAYGVVDERASLICNNTADTLVKITRVNASPRLSTPQTYQ